MSNGTEIKYNKEQISHGIEELKQCQKELYEADVLFYRGIMALAAAKGINLIIKEDAGINLYLPEKIVIECREEIGSLIDEITTKVALIETLDNEPKESSSDQIQQRETKIKIIDGESSSEPIQALYAPPSLPPEEPTDPSIDEPPIQTEIGEQPIQALYAPPTLPPEEPTDPSIGEPPIQTEIGEQPIQALYAPPGVVGPIIDIGTQPIQAVYAPPTLPPEEPIIGEIEASQAPLISTTMPEYESIPNTSTAGIIEENYISKHPKLIGGVATAMGLFGIPTILSDDFEDEEENED